MNDERQPPEHQRPRLVELVERSGYFDWAYYRRQRPGLAAVSDLLGHYLETGWRENLNPSSWFDTAYYLASNPDVRRSGMNPLYHFLRFGEAEGRLPAGPESSAADAIAFAIAPSAREWAALPPRPPARIPRVDVIVPVYRGLAETMRCIYSVLAAPVRTEYELLVVDDASPEPELVAALDELAAAGRIRLLRNAENRGFVASANRAMRENRARDVVLLNADTQVYGDWLDRLRAAAAAPGTATVTPFSNNAQICSYPSVMRNNAGRFELDDADLDRLAAEVNRGATVELPTAVGFCMHVSRACLQSVGYFDEASFGEGYGEENDFSRRAVAAGWRHLLAADVFVRHYGGVSFGRSKVRREQAALLTLLRLHPDYSDVVRTFVEKDPIAPYRERLDIARVRRAHGGRTFLFVTHKRGGGTERHVLDLAGRVAADGAGVLFCRAEKRVGDRVRFQAPPLNVPNLPVIEIPRDIEHFTQALVELGVVHVHVHHLADFPPVAADFFRVAAQRAALAYDVTVHDYLAICPRINLIDASGIYCGEPDESGCARCLARAGSEFGAPPIWTWRDRYARFLHGARTVFVPDDDVSDRLRTYYPQPAYAVRPHADEPLRGAPAPAPPRRSPVPGRRRVGLIGAIGPHKGSRVLLECARDARERDVPIDFSVIGYTDIDCYLQDLGVRIYGAYAEDELGALLARARLDVAWFPSVWPETYCYTLSAALRAEIFPVAFDIGAPAGRLRALGWGHVMPLDLVYDPAEIVDALAALDVVPFPRGARAAAHASGPGFIASYYGLPFGGDPPLLEPELDPLPALALVQQARA